MMTSATERQVSTIATSVGAEGLEIFCNRELNMKQVLLCCVGSAAFLSAQTMLIF